MSKTKLDQNDIHHQHLIALMAAFVDDWGYTSRELFELLDSTKSMLWPALREIELEKKKNK